jgi:hypothetical protein
VEPLANMLPDPRVASGALLIACEQWHESDVDEAHGLIDCDVLAQPAHQLHLRWSPGAKTSLTMMKDKKAAKWPPFILLTGEVFLQSLVAGRLGA